MNFPARLLVPYGTERIPAQLTHVREAQQGLAAGETAEVGLPGAPVVSLDLGSNVALPMQALRHPFTLPPLAQDLAHGASQLACLRHHLVKICGLWAKSQVAFIEAYFDAIVAHVAERKDALAARIGVLSGLVEPAHWCFSAPMPLPRAHLCLDESGFLSDPGSVRSIKMDVLFRDRRGLLALDLSRGHLTGNRRRDLEALEAAGVRIHRLAGAFPIGPGLLELLGSDFSDFTDDVALPNSPFHGSGLPVPV
jgi:hypothetical protein